EEEGRARGGGGEAERASRRVTERGEAPGEERGGGARGEERGERQDDAAGRLARRLRAERVRVAARVVGADRRAAGLAVDRDLPVAGGAEGGLLFGEHLDERRARRARDGDPQPVRPPARTRRRDHLALVAAQR